MLQQLDIRIWMQTLDVGLKNSGKKMGFDNNNNQGKEIFVGQRKGSKEIQKWEFFKKEENICLSLRLRLTQKRK